MAAQTLTCPDYGRVGTVTGQAIQPGVATLDIMQGLDPANCPSCPTVLESRGYRVASVRPTGDRTARVEPA